MMCEMLFFSLSFKRHALFLHSPSFLNTAAFGVKGGQQVSIAVINLNSDITTFVASAPVIKASTPGLVSLAESIASSQDLADKVSSFVGLTTSKDDRKISGSNNGNAAGVFASDDAAEVTTSSSAIVGSTLLLPSLLWGGLFVTIGSF